MRRPVILVLATAAGVFAALLLVVAIALRTVDPQTLARPVQQKLKETTGRDLVVNGGIELGFSLEPRLTLKDVALSNAAWGSAPNMLTAKQLDVELALLPLLSRRVEILKLTVVEPVIALETDAQGRRNWRLGGAERGGPSGTGSAGGAASALTIGELGIERGLITYRVLPSGKVTRIDVARFTLDARHPDAAVNAEFKGAIDGVQVALTGHAGPLQALLEQRTPYPIALEGDIGGRKTVAKASLRTQDAALALEQLDLKIGSSTVTGSIARVKRGTAESLVVKLASPRLVLADLEIVAAPAAAAAKATPTPKAPPSKPPATSTPPAAAAAAPARYVLSEAALPLDALADLDVDAELRVGELVAGQDLTLRNVVLAFAARDGQLTTRQAEATLFDGRVEGQLALRTRADPPTVNVGLKGRDLKLGPLLAALNTPRQIDGGATAIDLRLASRGRSLHDWAARADGTIVVSVGPARLKGGIGDSPLARVAGAMRGTRDAGSVTALACAVVRLPVQGGVARVDRSIAAETDLLEVVGSGTVDLARETLDLKFRPRVRAGVTLDVGALGELVHVQGSWRNPDVGVDAAASAATVARLGGALAGGGSWRDLASSLFTSPGTRGSPCADALSGKASAPAPAPDTAAARGDLSPLQQELGRALGRLLGR